MDDGQIVIVLVFWAIVNGLIGQALGKLRGQAGAGGLLAIVLGPIGWLLTLGLHDQRPHCAECGGVVTMEARRCMHCGVEFEDIKLCGKARVDR
jgi:hypothetical protein